MFCAAGCHLRTAACAGLAVDLAGAVTWPQNASCVASTSMGALAPNIFYYRVVDKRSFPRGRIVLCTRAHGVQSGVVALAFGFSAERFPNRLMHGSSLVRYRLTTVNFTMFGGLH